MTLAQMEAINEAIAILNTLRSKAALGSTVIWRVLDHAANHLDKELKAALVE